MDLPFTIIVLSAISLFYLETASKLLQEFTTETVTECIFICGHTGSCDGVVYDAEFGRCRLMQGNDTVSEWTFRRDNGSSAEFHHFHRTSGCPSDDWVSSGLSALCFLKVKTETTWDGSRTGCLDLGGDLLDLSDEGAMAYVGTLTRTRNYWVGAYYRKGSYFWFGGGKMDDLLESVNRAGPEECVIYREVTAVLKLKPCSKPYYFLCQKTRA